MFKIWGPAWWCLGRPFWSWRVGEGLDRVSFSFFTDGWARDGGRLGGVIIFYFSLGKAEAWWGLGFRIYELVHVGFVFFYFWFFVQAPLYIYFGFGRFR